MKLSVIFAFFIFALFFTSCDVQFEEKNVNGEFTIELPSYMVELDLGLPSAALQYGNDDKEHYIMIVRENPIDLVAYGVTDLESYAGVYLSNIELSIAATEITKVDDEITERNGMSAIAYEVVGVMPDNGLKMYYYIQFYQSESAFYYVCDWTLHDFKEDYQSDMKRITNSIKEL